MTDRAGDGDDAKRSHIGRWRTKAEELRAIADGMKGNHHAGRLMLNAVANYDRLADEAEERDRPEASSQQGRLCPTSYPGTRSS